MSLLLFPVNILLMWVVTSSFLREMYLSNYLPYFTYRFNKFPQKYMSLTTSSYHHNGQAIRYLPTYSMNLY